MSHRPGYPRPKPPAKPPAMLCTDPNGADVGEIRTLRPLVLEDRPHFAAPGPRRRGLFVDVETTGFDPERDAVIELAMLPFVYTLDGGLITEVLRDEARTWRQNPGRALPAEITHLTGLTDEDLAGEQIDIRAADDLIARSHLVVAHNAGFDRPFLEKSLPTAQGAAWACSRHEVPWDTARHHSLSLTCLLCAHGVYSPVRHRAAADCEAGVWLLAQHLPGTSGTVFAALRETAARPAVRIWATGAPYAAKDELRTRGYRWMAKSHEQIPRSWWTDVDSDDLDAECEWLRDLYQAHGSWLDPVRLPQRDVTARERWRPAP